MENYFYAPKILGG